MSEFSTLTIKIPLQLKETIKAIAIEKQLSLSAEVCERLEQSLNGAGPAAKTERKSVKKTEPAIDNLHTEEVTEQPLSQKELRKLRQLLKNTGKKK